MKIFLVYKFKYLSNIFNTLHVNNYCKTSLKCDLIFYYMYPKHFQYKLSCINTPAC